MWSGCLVDVTIEASIDVDVVADPGLGDVEGVGGDCGLEALDYGVDHGEPLAKEG